MAKLYPKCPQKKDIQNPTEDTVNFLLNYSKALNVLNCGKKKFEILLN